MIDRLFTSFDDVNNAIEGLKNFGLLLSANGLSIKPQFLLYSALVFKVLVELQSIWMLTTSEDIKESL